MTITNYNRRDENGNPAGGQSYGIGFTIAWQDEDPDSPDGQCQNGAILIEVLEACYERLQHYQCSNFARSANVDAINKLWDSLMVLKKARLNQRKEAGTLGTHKED